MSLRHEMLYSSHDVTNGRCIFMYSQQGKSKAEDNEGEMAHLLSCSMLCLFAFQDVALLDRSHYKNRSNTSGKKKQHYITCVTRMNNLLCMTCSFAVVLEGLGSEEGLKRYETEDADQDLRRSTVTAHQYQPLL